MNTTADTTTFRKNSYPKFGPTTRRVETPEGVEHFRIHDGAFVARVRPDGDRFIVEAAIVGAFGVRR